MTYTKSVENVLTVIVFLFFFFLRRGVKLQHKIEDSLDEAIVIFIS